MTYWNTAIPIYLLSVVVIDYMAHKSLNYLLPGLLLKKNCRPGFNNDTVIIIIFQPGKMWIYSQAKENT